jgi:hypothetical protein
MDMDMDMDMVSCSLIEKGFVQGVVTYYYSH